MKKKSTVVHAYIDGDKDIGHVILDSPLQEDSIGCCEIRAIKKIIKRAINEDKITWIDKGGNTYIYWQWDMFAEFYRADL